MEMIGVRFGGGAAETLVVDAGMMRILRRRARP
jgi:hypothetical protein